MRTHVMCLPSLFHPMHEEEFWILLSFSFLFFSSLSLFCFNITVRNFIKSKDSRDISEGEVKLNEFVCIRHFNLWSAPV